MKLTQQQQKKLQSLSRSSYKDFLVEYTEMVKTVVSDVRTPITCKPEIEKEVRLGICDIIDEYFIQKLGVLSGELDKPEDNWN